jgi:acylphosphatase
VKNQAIDFIKITHVNLAGMAKNNPEGSVQFSLQGDPQRLQKAIKIIREGTDKSANVNVTTKPAAVTPLQTFTVYHWTSTTRGITKPYDLVFKLRTDNNEITEKRAKKEYHKILCQILDAEDLKKLGNEERALCY